MKIGAQQKLAVLLALILLSVPVRALASEPLELLKSAAERVIVVLKDPRLKAAERKKERVEQLKAIINPIFDYEEVARRTLAAHWRRRSAAEQEEFTKLFRAFLEKIYSDRIGLYEGEHVVFGQETVDQEYAEVEAKLISLKDEESRVLYRLKRSNGKWKVYDAVVENISIVNNYRSQFDRVISKSSFDELKRMLREKAG
jgi:phospholipid transport system substrate-binding protein